MKEQQEQIKAVHKKIYYIWYSMTIKELYHYAINHSLLDTEVNEVIASYNKENAVKSYKLDLTKVEYTYEDLIALFS